MATQDELNAALQKVTTLIDDFGKKLGAWAAGVAGGGPANDGKYPLPNSLGATVAVACPAQMAADSQKILMAGAGTIIIGQTAGYTGEGNNQYTLKAADAGKVFVLISNAGGSGDIRLLLPDNLPRGWSVVVVQAGNNRLRFRKVNDPDSTNSQLRNRQGFYATAANGSLAVAFVDSITSGNNNNVITIAGDVAA
jgi:hypothetical protein